MHKSRTAASGCGVLLRRGDHQFDAIELVRLTRAGVVVDRDDVRLRVEPADLAEHATARDMVRQARERLRADDVGAARFDELHDLAREQPAFAGLHADRRDGLRLGHELVHRQVLVEFAATRVKRIVHRLHVGVDHALERRVQRLVAPRAQIVLTNS